ncbi:MAG: MBOAT family O-acyltransferase, partial [Bacillota bacterium]
IKPVARFRDFYYFVTFFPHLVAGPIIRAEQFLYQMPRTRRPRLRVFNAGVFLIIRGLFLKMVCADNIALVVNGYWNSGYRPGANSLSLLVLAVLFAVQIFCDFEGYSSIARGLAYLMGFRFPVNFNCPYLATSFRNFWERWHITLSQWLRDYLYIPLGGNRVSKWRTYVNLMTVMLLGGLWHGAAMTFVAWGALHGLALAIERLLGFHKLEKTPGALGKKIAWYVVVQVVVLVTWVFFRSDSMDNALMFLRNIAACRSGASGLPFLTAAMFVLPVVAMHVHQFLVERGTIRPIGLVGKAVLAAVMLYATLVFYGQSSSFIYFQF